MRALILAAGPGMQHFGPGPRRKLCRERGLRLNADTMSSFAAEPIDFALDGGAG